MIFIFPLVIPRHILIIVKLYIRASQKSIAIAAFAVVWYHKTTKPVIAKSEARKQSRKAWIVSLRSQ